MATSQVETVSTGADKAKLAVAVLLAVAALASFYLLARQGDLVRWAVLLAGLAAAVGVFFTAEVGRRLWAYFGDSWNEVKKVVWPSRKETIQMTAYVFGFVLIMALFLWMTDKTLEWLLYSVVLGWR